MASTTKMTTFLVVIQELENSPELLDLEVTVSERAGRTGGATSGIEPGERISVRDLLYAVMLPSGNDASVALAEAVGRRFLSAAELTGDEAAVNRAAYNAFVRRMNAIAKDLGLSGTRYVNAHGMDAEGHYSTVSDLAKIAREGMRHAIFREICNTRVHTATIHTPDGGNRQTTWQNSNVLLDTEGFYGVKTGTTRRARACVVSAGQRGDDRLIAVVMGSSSDPARYIDSRNLYRFAWLELGHAVGADSSPRN